MDKLLFLLFCLFSCITGQAQDNGLKYPAPENTRFRIIGYVPGYRDVSQIPDETLSRMDIACYAFATIDSTGFPIVRDEKQMKKQPPFFLRKLFFIGIVPSDYFPAAFLASYDAFTSERSSWIS